MNVTSSKTISVFSFLVCLSTTSCLFVYDPPADVDERLKIVNNSSSTVYYYLSMDTNLTSSKGLVPFESFRSNSKNSEVDTVFYNRLEPGRVKTVKHFRKWEEELDQGAEDRVMVYFFEEEVILNTAWKEIVKDSLFLSKKSFDLGRMKDSNWLVQYP